MLDFDKRKKDDIETTVEVKTSSDVDFETKEEWVNPITKMRRKRRAKKEEEERKRREEEEKEQRKERLSWILIIGMIVILNLVIFIPTINNNNSSKEESQIITGEERSAENKNENTEGETVVDSSGGETIPKTYKDSSENYDRDNPAKKYSNDLWVSNTKSYDFGYIEVDARVLEYNDEYGYWRFIILDKDGGTQGSRIGEGNFKESDIPGEYRDIFYQCENDDEGRMNYVFTLRGEASSTPVREGTSGANTGFKFYPDTVVKIEYIPKSD